MEGFSTPYIYFCLGNFLFVITCLICSMLRWFHVCNEYRHNINFFFPARRVVTLMFGTQVLQSFYWMNVFSDTAFFYAAVFGVVAIPPLLYADGTTLFLLQAYQWQGGGDASATPPSSTHIYTLLLLYSHQHSPFCTAHTGHINYPDTY